jgi:hypothetical protein
MNYLSQEFLIPKFVYTATFRVREVVLLVCEIAAWTTLFLTFIHRLVFRTEHKPSETVNLALSNESSLLGVFPFFIQGRKQIPFSKRYVLDTSERRSAEGQQSRVL